jgi:cytochrome d ubiquinol oxidase subunit I
VLLELDNVLLSRLLTAMTLIFHIIFATIGVGVPILISGAELIGIKKKDPDYLLLARRWSKGYVITVAVGVVTGTIIGLQLSLLWPSFMRVAGQVIALPLFLETFAFFFEAIFLGMYLYTWNRFKNPLFHWLLSVPVVIGASLSAFFITTVNAFMNAPQGFELKGDKIVNIQPLIAMFNPATPSKVSHVVSSAYLTSAFILAAITAYLLIKNKYSAGATDYYKKALKFTISACFIFALATIITGDISGKYLAKYQPEKLAAADWHFETERDAPLYILGILTENKEIKYGLKIPFGLSFLAHGHPSSEVVGLNDFPSDELPPLWIHYAFDFMVIIGMYLMTVPFIFILLSMIKRTNPFSLWLLWAIVIGGPLSMTAIELGWIYAEVGRQPWLLRGYMKVIEGATTSENVFGMLILFFILYVILGVLTVIVLRRMFKNHPVEIELGQ